MASRPEATPGGGGGAALLALAAELVDVASVSEHEAAIAGLVDERLRRLGGFEVSRIGDNVVARTHSGAAGEGRPRLMLAGHLDTVPPAGNERARVEGSSLWGVGSCDMKGGVAVMLALAGAIAGTPGRGAGTAGPVAPAVTLCFYAREEVARSRSGLLEIARQRPQLLEADAALLLEPTGGAVEAGCQGVLRMTLRAGGARAHAARHWTGVNAVHRLAPMLSLVAASPERRPLIDGCEYRESLVAVGVSGGVAGNVVPDSAELKLSHRFAPDRSAGEAFASVRELLAPAMDASLDELVLDDAAPPAPPSLEHPLLAAVVTSSGVPVRAKLGWTDVATFAELGVPAANFGPGDPLLAHSAGEHVTAAELEAVYRAIAGVTGAA